MRKAPGAARKTALTEPRSLARVRAAPRLGAPPVVEVSRPRAQRLRRLLLRQARVTAVTVVGWLAQ